MAALDPGAQAAASGEMVVWAEWCGPCRAIAPVLEELAEASEGRVTLMKVNADENPGLAARYGIRSIPTILFVKEGRVVDRITGAIPKAELQDVLIRWGCSTGTCCSGEGLLHHALPAP